MAQAICFACVNFINSLKPIIMKAIAMLNYVTKNNDVKGFVATHGKMRCELNYDLVCGRSYHDKIVYFVTEKPLDVFLFPLADAVFAKDDKIAFAYIMED